ncbi:hypothetical protein K0T92_09055 [Paenibacillus oenotherae]|uniref:Uncharacterized protein n=1 Tax=Paenibacillus oenotherae TaxID=1435645 RepID=A0ABS7D5Y0_9BACL|nr:hypothetical protein [Paenibacillus oenotherae]MBW7474891.1 hypothetical protein [Paenibacillus oenotherae]
MANDLTVPSGTTLTLDDNPPEHLRSNLERIPIVTFNDLITAGFVSSEDTLKRLLDSAKEATKHALSRRDVQHFRVQGTTRIDLRRFGNFTLAAHNTMHQEQSAFWNLYRDIEPLTAVKLDSTAKITDLLRVNRVVYKFLFHDVVIEQNAVLEIKKPTNTFWCNELLIKKTGRIVVKKNGVRIKAFSIQGEQ